MMADDPLLRINTRLAAEEFEEEIVLLDVVRGLYFSLGGAAVDLWRAFGEARAALEVVDALCARQAGADRAALMNAIDGMRDHQLLLPAASGDPDSGARPPIPAAAGIFLPPVVEAFSDLADLIAIDPVHEVDAATGWPVRPAHFPDAD
ncbi:MAG: hypothetical protein K0Q91_553 [Fibrobacteria bacterium]|jgi:hypothetical protein|nr:hypothetical protein [Fibrobacteria bacterium]